MYHAVDRKFCCDSENSFSPCRVLPFVLLGAIETTESLPQVTLSTHATADQVYGIVELARRWEGPISLAVFAPGLDAGLAVAQLDRACRCEPTMYKVSSQSRISCISSAMQRPVDPQSFHAFVNNAGIQQFARYALLGHLHKKIRTLYYYTSKIFCK